ncbi:phosphoenolpyruvate--protein phosphotransferase [Agathobaculum sp. NSJ-28]|uniref:Phosphoenolpyruvate-protein phosphotransferase n=2 Tax=Agathobaculum TaxID=2048137 RepID=A0A923LTP0_9FIRM|nr:MULTISPECIES: phosphoenolpyruvate--protein phosphotransferase [Butyricicoccaceae]MBC5723955.1 phosphoenolpyruvate--protein phosphotransferase [Agathobaculum faecis]MCU6787584.1 phosphoenolpyruvate--protein phosphotransferase [Agathobaculum ammoniilyticum]WOC74120.1 phosphoenolpyruvate--protein phosphotransferase [Intestinibacillus sp. NTUH-41-i26]SCI39471.1 Phosphoenolpyruvate-protein phosphotransferase [uncultured Butyricicoccus sp.]
MLKFKAIGVSEGLAHAKALVIKEADLTVVKNSITDAAAEQKRVIDAVEHAKKQIELLRDEAEKNIGAAEAEIFDAHLLMLDDPDFVEGITNLIADEMVCAEYACFVNCENFQAMFRAMDDEYMQARAADIGDISQRILKNLKGIADNAIDSISEPCIIIANDLTPSDTAKIGSKPVVGFVTRIGGRTSHSAIMARSMGIPAVAGAGEKADEIKDGEELLLDGATGEIVVSPDAETLSQFEQKKTAEDERRAMLVQFKNRPGETSDGRRVIVEGNIGTPEDAVRVAELGGEGVGLFRSEFLFMDRDDLPSEEEQFEAYKKACETMAGKPVIIRTLDIGGDKEVPALNLEKEQNPFLGYRAIRICLNQTDLFVTQLRALLRAAQYGDLRIMFPMISSIEEIRNAKQVLQQAKDLLDAEGVAYNPNVKVGIMVEIPVAAVCADMLAKEVDFFSIGTNDLIQYSCAVDRINEKISYLYRPLHPGVLRLIHMTAKAANENGIEVGVCGEMAGTPGMAPVLCGLGVTNLSMSASAMLAAKADLAAHSFAECKEFAERLLCAASATEAEQLFAEWRA